MKSGTCRSSRAIMMMATSLSIVALHSAAQSPDAFSPAANGVIYAMAVQADGRILVGGDFTTLAGPGSARVKRLDAAGAGDASFDAGTGAAGRVVCLAVQADGKVLVGGEFKLFDGNPRNHLARLNLDGSLDSTFDPSPSSAVKALVVLPDGKILVGGEFGSLGGQARKFLGRLNHDGTLDPSFAVDLNAPVNSLAVQADGAILLGGGFTSISGSPRSRVARISSNGTLDAGFNPGADDAVFCLAIQRDGQIWVGGSFTNLGGQPCNRIGKLDPSGWLLNASASGANNTVYSLGLQANGKVIVGGNFSSLGGQTRSRIGRLNPDGTADEAFIPSTGGPNTGVNGRTYCLAIQTDGKILVGGDFNLLAGQPRGNLGRLLNTEPAVDQLEFNGSEIAWLRGGAAPEVWRTKFEFSTNQTSWMEVGVGQPEGETWRLSATNIPPDANLRALAVGSSGYQNGSAIAAETVIGRPILRSQPASRTNNFGSSANFQTTVVGSLPLTYRWWKDGQTVSDGGKISGSANANLNLSNLSGLEAGEYWLVVSNLFASVTSSVARLTVVDPVITTPPGSGTGHLGQPFSFSVSASGTSPLRYQWRHHGSNLVGRTTTSLSLPAVQFTNRGEYDVVVTNLYGSITSATAQLSVNLTAFDSLSPSANNDVYAIAIQADKKTVVGGRFLNFGGATRERLARLNADGTLDTTFAPTANGEVFAVAIQEDGKIIVAGWFTSLGGKPRSYIGRLHRDGTLDEGFDPGATGGTQFPGVYSVVIQADGKIVVGGDFQILGGVARTNLGRLNPDGSVDFSFVANADNIVYPLAIQPDAKIIVGGVFSNLAGQACTRLGRLNSDGSLDSGFVTSANDVPLSIAVQPDGRIVVGGAFTTLSGESCNRIGRLNQDGSWDAAFYPLSGNPAIPHGASGSVRSIALQTDGSIVLGGSFFQLGGLLRQQIGRLRLDGVVDNTFAPFSAVEVFAVAIQDDGKILVGGRNSMKRLTNSDSADGALTYSYSTLNWSRSGAGPELWRVQFFASTNGSEWFDLGAGQRTNGAWRLNGVALPEDASLLARGFVTGGRYGCSSWFIEATAGPLCIGRQPLSRTNNPGTRASFDIAVGGALPVSYQWYRNGVKLNNDGSFSGVQTPMLILNSVNSASPASFFVVVSNSSGVVTSRVATLTVPNPHISSQPTSRTNLAGSLATFSVQGGGSPTHGYRWYHDGIALTNRPGLAGATSATLNLSNAFGMHGGNYFVVISNAAGTLTSSTAGLTVVDPVVLTSPSNHTVNVGGTTILETSALGTAPLRFQWRKDGKGLLGMTASTLVLNDAQTAQIGSYDAVVRNDFGSVTSALSFVSVNTALADSFNPGPDNTVFNLALQANGQIVIGGNFTNLAGASFDRIARLDSDGVPDPGFNPGSDATVRSLQVQPDDRILLGGSFDHLAGAPRTTLGRLTASGSLDLTFQPLINSTVYSSTLQPDGGILVAGNFNQVSGQPRAYLARLNSDGSLDVTFTPQLGVFITAALPLGDGSVLVGGNFTSVNGLLRSKVALLRWDGTLDSFFDPGDSIPTAGFVYALAVQSDGKILVGGAFKTTSGQTNLARLLPNGALDPSFQAGANGTVYSLAVRTDGNVLVGGDFTVLCGVPRGRIGRLNQIGSLDPTFDPGANAAVYSLVIQSDGRVLATGDFSEVGGQPRNRIARLALDGPVGETLMRQSNTVFWTRSGAGPEVLRTTFEYSTNQIDWYQIGSGARVPSGWMASHNSLPSAATIRARAYGSGGYWGGSSWMLEQSLSTTNLAPIILTEDASFGIKAAEFGFALIAPSGTTVVVETSTNLLHWSPVWTNADHGGHLLFRDPASSQLPCRFYRAKIQ